MPDTELSSLTETTTPISTDQIYINDGGTSKRVSYGNLIPTASTSQSGRVELATAAEAEALSDTARAVTPSSISNMAARAWATIIDTATTPTVSREFNVDSVTDLGVGQFNVNTTASVPTNGVAYATLLDSGSDRGIKAQYSGAFDRMDVSTYKSVSLSDEDFSVIAFANN